MTLRTKSRGQQWARWLIAAALSVCAYVVAFRVLYEGSLGDVFGAMQLRVLLPVLTAFGVFAYETRWDGVMRKGKSKSKEVKSVEKQSVGRAVPRAPQSSCDDAALNSDCGGQGAAHPADSPSPFDASLPGEAEYAEARLMPHRPIPDVEHDGEYLKMLAKSAELGYPRAMAKLGDYAMRRGCDVEAYYWLWRAKRAGMDNLDRTLLQVRSAWASGGFCRESMNEYDGFTHEQGTIGYALLCIDARHNADAAKARLADLIGRSSASRGAFLGGSVGFAASAALALPGEKPLFTMGLVCDTHVGGTPYDPVTGKRRHLGCERVKMALEVFRRQGCDIVVNDGDVCDFHFPDLYPKIRATFEEVFAGAAKRPKMWYVYAGHDVLGFHGHDRSKFMEDREPALNEMRDLLGAENPQKVWVTDVKGIPVVLFREWSDKDDRYAEVLRDVCAGNPGKPVLVFDHYPAFDTVSKSHYNGGYIRRRMILDSFPQVIHISAHLHNTMRDPGQLWQGTFTAYNCGCLYDWSRPLSGCAESDCRQGWEVSLLEMYRSSVVFRRFDIRTGAEIEPLEPWTVPLPFNPETAPFRRDERRRVESVPAFPRGARLAVSVAKPAEGVLLTFPSATGSYNYRIETFRRSAGGAWTRFSLRAAMGDCHLPEGERPESVTHLLPASLFVGEKSCRVVVTPETAFGSAGTPLMAEFAAPAASAAGETVYLSNEPLAELEVKPWDKKLKSFAKSADGWLAIPGGICNVFGRLILPEKAFAHPVGTKYRITYEFRVDGPAGDHVQTYLTAPTGGRYVSDRIYTPMGDTGAQRIVIDWKSTVQVPVPVLNILAFARWTKAGHDFKLRFDSLRIARLS